MTEIAIVLTAFAIGIGCIVVCCLKGKWWVAGIWGVLLGWLLPSPVTVICSIRMAKPGSWWYRERYGVDEQAQSRVRHWTGA